MSKLFIIGNGFDIDLGYKTRYSDFARCKQLWPFNGATSGLAGFLEKKKETERWLDIEKCLLEYAVNLGGTLSLLKDKGPLIETDRDSYEKLICYLSTYIKRIEQEYPIDKDSIAVKVYKAIIDNGGFKAYSFNYTDLNEISSNLGIGTMDCIHVHGSVKEDSIILGVDSTHDVYKGYDFMYKVYSPEFQSSCLRQDLALCEEVVIFGHSLGDVDYSYFKAFFKSLCREDISMQERKKVTIFTYDDNSRFDILRQLREMNDKQMQLMFNNSDFQILCTTECRFRDKARFEKFLQHLHDTTVIDGIGSAF